MVDTAIRKIMSDFQVGLHNLLHELNKFLLNASRVDIDYLYRYTIRWQWQMNDTFALFLSFFFERYDTTSLKGEHKSLVSKKFFADKVRIKSSLCPPFSNAFLFIGYFVWVLVLGLSLNLYIIRPFPFCVFFFDLTLNRWLQSIMTNWRDWKNAPKKPLIWPVPTHARQ